MIGEAKVYGGEPSSVNLVAKEAVRVLVPRGSTERLSARIAYQGPLLPPVTAGMPVGKLRIQRGDTLVLEVPVYADEDSVQGKLTRRAFDAATELVLGYVRSKLQKQPGT